MTISQLHLSWKEYYFICVNWIVYWSIYNFYVVARGKSSTISPDTFFFSLNSTFRQQNKQELLKQKEGGKQDFHSLQKIWSRSLRPSIALVSGSQALLFILRVDWYPQGNLFLFTFSWKQFFSNCQSCLPEKIFFHHLWKVIFLNTEFKVEIFACLPLILV